MDAYGTKVEHIHGLRIHDIHLIPVEFRLVVFKPFVSEVLIGKVESSTEEGIRGAEIDKFLPWAAFTPIFASLYDIL